MCETDVDGSRGAGAEGCLGTKWANQALSVIPVDRMYRALLAQYERHQVQGNWVTEDDVVMLGYCETIKEGIAWQGVVGLTDQLHLLQNKQIKVGT